MFGLRCMVRGNVHGDATTNGCATARGSGGRGDRQSDGDRRRRLDRPPGGRIRGEQWGAGTSVLGGGSAKPSGSTPTWRSRKHCLMPLVSNPRHGVRKRNPPATRRRALELLAGCGAEDAQRHLCWRSGFTIASSRADFLAGCAGGTLGVVWVRNLRVGTEGPF
jgi:hypothetical protein